MSNWTNAEDPSLHYYDGDYPSEHHAVFRENFDETTRFQGLMHDVERYRAIAKGVSSSILELCCGTGRVTIPLARDGHDVTGVDLSSELLRQLRHNVERAAPEARDRLHLIEADVTSMALERRDFALAIVAFNSLLCIADFEGQRQAIRRVHQHLRPGGLLVIDAVNPVKLKLEGDVTPKPFFTRKNPHTGNRYTRFAMCDALDQEQRQRLHGWYDEVEGDGRVRRRAYSLTWRPIFRFELELMLREAGFVIEAIEGGHQGEPFSAASPRMLVHARRR